jgi:hypothetical protein
LAMLLTYHSPMQTALYGLKMVSCMGSNDRDTATEFQIELVGVTLFTQTDLVL